MGRRLWADQEEKDPFTDRSNESTHPLHNPRANPSHIALDALRPHGRQSKGGAGLLRGQQRDTLLKSTLQRGQTALYLIE